MAPRIRPGGPVYIPLKHNDYAELGKLVAMFGYIEMFVDQTIMHILGIKNVAVHETLMGGKNSGSKASLLRQLADSKLVVEPNRKAVITTFCDRHDQVVGRRHLAVHGIWNENPAFGGVAAHSWRRRGTRLLASDLPSVVADTRDLIEKGMIMWAAHYLPGVPPEEVLTSALMFTADINLAKGIGEAIRREPFRRLLARRRKRRLSQDRKKEASESPTPPKPRRRTKGRPPQT